ncbi:uncharacterized protein LOC107474700 [Arachis duranensis]|uniref:Uncharacterized protein LOC107474700 n=1 Tax=Arachis duranensis TaxID=130453 RepID=A0A6P4CEA2_ARADU|nr:uncharacterized protein LOC107474700 [Arachis duranensis]
MDNRRCNLFANWIDRCGLLDLGCVGSKFTWRGPIWEGYGRVFKRLDRALANDQWRTKFQDHIVQVLPRINSDHHPILITEAKFLKEDRPFIFEIMWTQHPSFEHFLHQHWNKKSGLNNILSTVRNELKE